MSVIKKPWMAGPQMNSAQEQVTQNIQDTHLGGASEQPTRNKEQGPIALEYGHTIYNAVTHTDLNVDSSEGFHVQEGIHMNAHYDTKEIQKAITTKDVEIGQIRKRIAQTRSNHTQEQRKLEINPNDKKAKSTLESLDSTLLEQTTEENVLTAKRKELLQLLNVIQHASKEAYEYWTQFNNQTNTIEPDENDEQRLDDMRDYTDDITSKHILDNMHHFATLRAIAKKQHQQLQHLRNVITGLELQLDSGAKRAAIQDRHILEMQNDLDEAGHRLQEYMEENSEIMELNTRLRDELSALSDSVIQNIHGNYSHDNHVDVTSTTTTVPVSETEMIQMLNSVHGWQLQRLFMVLLQTFHTFIERHEHLKATLESLDRHKTNKTIQEHLKWSCTGSNDDQYLRKLEQLSKKNLQSIPDSDLRKECLDFFRKSKLYETETTKIERLQSKLQANPPQPHPSQSSAHTGPTAAPAGAAQNPQDEDHGKAAPHLTLDQWVHFFNTEHGDTLQGFYTIFLEGFRVLIEYHKNLKSDLQQFHNHGNNTDVNKHLKWVCAGYSDEHYLTLIDTLTHASQSESEMRKTGIDIVKTNMLYQTENEKLEKTISKLQANQSSELHGSTAADAGTGQGNSGGYQPPAGTVHGTPGGHHSHAGTTHGHHGRNWHNRRNHHIVHPSGTRGGPGLTEEEKAKRKQTLDNVINYMLELGEEAAFYKPYYEYVKKTHGNNLQPISPPTTVITDEYQTNLDLCKTYLEHWLCESTTRGPPPGILPPRYFKDDGGGYWVPGDATSV